MNRTRLAAVLAILVAAAARGQMDDPDGTKLRGQSDQAAARVAEAERKLADGKAADAADDLIRLLDDAGDELVPADGKARRHFLPARSVVQPLLAKLPADVLRGYRDRVDAPAAKLLAAGKTGRDARPLRTLIDRHLASRPAEDALRLLGELAFERGEFRTAEGYWRRLLTNPDPDRANGPPFPDPTGDPTGVRARVVLALIFQGELDRAKQELAALDPKAKGRLAGKDGPFADTLKELLGKPPTVPPDDGDGDWTGFAGNAARNGRAGGRLPYYWPTRPTWVAPIPRDQAVPAFPRPAHARSVAFHPVVLDGVAYLADPTRVHGFDLRTGQPRFAYDVRAQEPGKAIPRVPQPLPFGHDADFTLTAADGRLFARLGLSPLFPSADAVGEKAGPTSYLVGFAPPARPGSDGPPLEPKWTLAPPLADGDAAAWEAAPVWANGRLYAVVSRRSGTRVVQAVACYDDPPGRPLWVADVCDSQMNTADGRHRHEPLTLAGGNVVFCSHTGVVAAVDAATGKPAWAFRYPKPKPTGAASPRDLCPAVADGGRVFVAPADAEFVFAVDAETGRPLWEAGPFQAEQLLGVARGRLIVTLAEPQRGIRGLSVATGSDQEPDGWRVHDDPRLGSFGRGLVSDDRIMWPTRTDLFLLDPATGRPSWSLPRIRGPHGNLAYANGVLLVATPTELWGYVSDRVELPERRKAAAARPDDVDAEWDLKRALADAGNWDAPRPEWLADRAERELLKGNPAAARGLLQESLRDEVPASWRARAVGRLLSLEPRGGGGAAAETFRTRVPAAAFDGEWVYGPNGAPMRLGELIARHFGVTASVEVPPPPRTRTVPAFDVGRVPRLGTGMSVEHETDLSGVVPLLPFAGERGLPGMSEADPRLLVADGPRVLAYRPGTDRPAWTRELPDGLTVVAAAVSGDSVIAAGLRGVARLRLADGSLVGSFHLPDADPVPPTPSPMPLLRPAGLVVPSFALSDFALAGSRLVARASDHHLIAVDLETGRVAWVLDALGRNALHPVPFDDAPRFNRHVYADDRAVLVQLSNGTRWEIDPLTGRPSKAATARVAWDGPPVRFSAEQVAVADGPGLTRGFAPDRTRAEWSAAAGGEASLTGRPPTFLPVPGGVLTAVSRNHGVELEVLSAVAGARLWRAGPTLLPVAAVDLASADHDASHAYIPADGKVFAVSLADGQVLKAIDPSAELGLSGPVRWQVRAGRRGVLLWPAEPVALDSPAAVLGRLLARLPLGPDPRQLPALAAGLYDAGMARTAPLLLLDPETGRVRQRLDVPCGPVFAVHVGPDAAVAVTASKAYRLKFE